MVLFHPSNSTDVASFIVYRVPATAFIEHKRTSVLVEETF